MPRSPAPRTDAWRSVERGAPDADVEAEDARAGGRDGALPSCSWVVTMVAKLGQCFSGSSEKKLRPWR